MGAKVTKKQRTIRGTVARNRWDDNDNLIGVIIEADDGYDYVVKPEQQGEELLKHVDTIVEAQGVVTTEENQRYILVTSFDAIDADSLFEDDDDDDDDRGRGRGYDDDDDHYEREPLDI